MNMKKEIKEECKYAKTCRKITEALEGKRKLKEEEIIRKLNNERRHSKND